MAHATVDRHEFDHLVLALALQPLGLPPFSAHHAHTLAARQRRPPISSRCERCLLAFDLSAVLASAPAAWGRRRELGRRSLEALGGIQGHTLAIMEQRQPQLVLVYK